MPNHRKLTDGGRVFFSRPQLVFVGILFGMASVVIFFLGVLIGQSIEERKLLRHQDELVKVPVNTNSKKDDVITFYDTLTKPKPPVVPKVSEKLKAVQSQPSWTVQVTAHRSRSTADSMVTELKKRGYKAYITAGKLRTKTAAGKIRTAIFYRVRVGRYDTRQEAMVELRRLPKTAKYKNAMIVGY